MRAPRVLYLHGLHSTPGGVKPTYLRSLGYEVLNPHLPDDDFDESVRRARSALETEKPDALVGSSRGGAVALAIADGSIPLVLIAPAWKKWGTAAAAPASTMILHASADAVIPLSDSRELLRLSRLPDEALVIIGDDHNMTDPAAFGALRAAVEWAAGR